MDKAKVDALLKRAQDLGPGYTKTPRIPEGDHILALDRFTVKDTKKVGVAAIAEFVVVESDKLRVNDRVATLWPLEEREDEYGYAAKRLHAFVQALTGCASDEIAEQTNALRDDTQPACGMVVGSFGRKTTSKKGKEFLDVSFVNVDQTASDVKTMRAHLDSIRKEVEKQDEKAAEPAKKTSMLDRLRK